MKTFAFSVAATALAAILTGCCPKCLIPQPLPVCRVDTTWLKPCTNPSLADTGTFADALRDLQLLRQKLSECELRRAALQDRILSCNESIEAYNKKIQEDATKK